jgi:hypothetical protein
VANTGSGWGNMTGAGGGGGFGQQQQMGGQSGSWGAFQQQQQPPTQGGFMGGGGVMQPQQQNPSAGGGSPNPFAVSHMTSLIIFVNLFTPSLSLTVCSYEPFPIIFMLCASRCAIIMAGCLSNKLGSFCSRPDYSIITVYWL